MLLRWIHIDTPCDYIRTGINSDDRIGDAISLTGHGHIDTFDDF